MSYTFTLTGRKSELTASFYPAIVLNQYEEYVLGLLNFESYHSIPNIDASNNKFYYEDKEIIIPEGCYEIEHINDFLRRKVKTSDLKENRLSIKANSNTLKSEVFTPKKIDFTKENNIGKLLGFKNRILSGGKMYESDFPVDINRVNTIRIDCNLTFGSYLNDRPDHTIHEFFPNVSPGAKIVESPKNVVYLPINTNIIDSITVKILDQDAKLINFRGEVITIRLHLKKLS